MAADAYAGASDSWERAIEAAIVALFDFLAAQSAQTTKCVVADCEGGGVALHRRERTIERFTDLLQPGFASTEVPPPRLVAEAIGGGIYELVRGHVLERRLAQLPGAAGNATIVALTPFIGAEGAADLVSSTTLRE